MQMVQGHRSMRQAKWGAPVTDEVHRGQVSGTSAPQPGGASQMKGLGAASLYPNASCTLQSTVALVADASWSLSFPVCNGGT